MSIKFSDYKGKYKIVSLALDETVKEDLQEKELPLVYAKSGYIRLFPENIVLSDLPSHFAEISAYNDYDVFEIWENGTMHRKYNDKSNDNYFYITGKCNSNCLMCPSPDAARKNAPDANISDLIDLARHIPLDTPHLTITGGEPFMVGEKIFPFISFLKEKFVHTEFLFLTNGRIFAVEKYWRKFKECAPSDSIVAIPVHGSCPEIHDQITRADNSFRQTVQGVKALLKSGIRVELRLVVNKLNINDFTNIARFILRELKGIDYVSIIAMEMTGNARVNQNQVWIPYREAFASIKAAVRMMVENGMDVKLYNFPLCTVERSFWTLCERSISPNKVRFAEVCHSCKHREDCGGVFAGTMQFERDELEAIR